MVVISVLWRQLTKQQDITYKMNETYFVHFIRDTRKLDVLYV